MKFVDEKDDAVDIEREMMTVSQRLRTLDGNSRLTIYARCVAILFLVAAIRYWSQIIMVGSIGGYWLPSTVAGAEVKIMTFGVLYPIVGIGLWLLVPWAIPIWIMTAILQFLFLLDAPAFDIEIIGIFLLNLFGITVAFILRRLASQRNRPTLL